ncbi:hypothetical protein ACBY01_10795 [Sphingomonas sp. ac-8]|uniref:hypothetical protein n=1 Tax=Sphingomonas sp. ac-8 TaxID=3242977 RepID=UPI003A812161
MSLPPRPEESPSLVGRALSAVRLAGRGLPKDGSRAPAQAGAQGTGTPRLRLWAPVSARARPDEDVPASARPLAYRWPAAFALLLAAGPALTWAAATVAEHRTRAEIAALTPQAAPRLARARADAATRAGWAPLLAQPGVAATLERLAAALPADDRLARVAYDGTLEVAVLSADPDALRGALRRDPLLARLREVGQQRGDAAIRVTLRGTLP